MESVPRRSARTVERSNIGSEGGSLGAGSGADSVCFRCDAAGDIDYEKPYPECCPLGECKVIQ